MIVAPKSTIASGLILAALTGMLIALKDVEASTTPADLQLAMDTVKTPPRPQPPIIKPGSETEPDGPSKGGEDDGGDEVNGLSPITNPQRINTSRPSYSASPLRTKKP